MQVSLDDYTWPAALATALALTVHSSGFDELGDADGLVAFLGEHASRVPAATPVPAAELAEVRAVRDRVRDLLVHPERDRLLAGATALTAPGGELALDVDGDGDGRARWVVHDRADSSLAERLGLVCGVGILGVVRALGVDRFRPCADDTCSGVFVDTSRPGRRRYCVPELCGNRVNVAAHRARRAGR
jgi:predicted RNA-binding Zn ribbon-like protein